MAVRRSGAAYYAPNGVPEPRGERYFPSVSVGKRSPFEKGCTAHLHVLKAQKHAKNPPQAANSRRKAAFLCKIPVASTQMSAFSSGRLSMFSLFSYT